MCACDTVRETRARGMAGKRTRNLIGAGAAEDGDGWRDAKMTSESGEEEGKGTTRAVPAGVDICLTEAGCISQTRSERQKQEERSIVSAMVHLLVIASKPTSPYPWYHKLTLMSLKSVRRFLSSSVLQSQSFILQGLLAAMPGLLARRWEGFMHIALHCWAEDQNWDDMLGRSELGGPCQFSSNRLSDLYKGLLHVAIRQCGDKCSAFRKACLMAAQPSCKELHDTKTFESFFKILLQNVAQTAVFKEALEVVLTAIDTPASTSLDWMHWLRHLSGKHEARIWIDPVFFFHDRLTSGSSLEGLKDMDVNFTKAKTSFVSCASFTQARDVFITLLQKYRNSRKRFTNGMLALQM